MGGRPGWESEKGCESRDHLAKQCDGGGRGWRGFALAGWLSGVGGVTGFWLAGWLLAGLEGRVRLP